jgi:glutaredoxin
MKTLMYFYLKGCPYCRKADDLIASLISENPAYGKISIQRIEERTEADLANSYDYYYVPAFFLDGVNLHEGVATKEQIQSVLDAALKE